MNDPWPDAGPQLDVLVAERVMNNTITRVPDYSTSIAHAWDVLMEMLYREGTANIRLDMEDVGRERGDIAWVQIGDWTGFGPIAQAICHVALSVERAKQEPRG